jgi:hypothetical protein
VLPKNRLYLVGRASARTSGRTAHPGAPPAPPRHVRPRGSLARAQAYAGTTRARSIRTQFASAMSRVPAGSLLRFTRPHANGIGPSHLPYLRTRTAEPFAGHRHPHSDPRWRPNRRSWQAAILQPPAPLQHVLPQIYF